MWMCWLSRWRRISPRNKRINQEITSQNTAELIWLGLAITQDISTWIAQWINHRVNWRQTTRWSSCLMSMKLRGRTSLSPKGFWMSHWRAFRLWTGSRKMIRGRGCCIRRAEERGGNTWTRRRCRDSLGEQTISRKGKMGWKWWRI